MWIVIGRAKPPHKQCWVSGVFIDHAAACEYFSTLPPSIAAKETLIEIPAKNYPILLLHDFTLNDIIYVTLEELTKKLFSFKKLKDDDEQHCIYFNVQKDYRGFSPDDKYYKYINHRHVDDTTIHYLVKQGLHIDSVGGKIAGIYECANCSRLVPGILSSSGYQPPPHWQIISGLNPDDKLRCYTACSLDCRLSLEKDWADNS